MKKTGYRRLNITLPDTTVSLLDKVTNKGERSNFIDIAIRTYVTQTRQEDLRERLKQGALARGERDLELAGEWFDVEDEIWQR